MIHLGEYQTLIIEREMPQGYYLSTGDDEEVLLPRNFITDDMKVGGNIKVFVYKDSQEMWVATTETPKLTIGQFASLEVSDTSESGVFCKWGIVKELFIPISNQAAPLRTGDTPVVYMYVDEETLRLVGSTKLDRHLTTEIAPNLKTGDKLDLLVYKETDLGYKVVINQKYDGLIYRSELRQYLRIGEELTGYLKPIREDGKIDVSLTPIGYQNIEPEAQKILKKLEENDGFLPFTDKSDPNKIKREFGISKKLFKKSIGSLYKQKQIIIKDDGIYRTGSDSTE